MPNTCDLDQRDTHRLIPSQFAEDGASVLTRLTDDENTLEHIFELDNATNDRLLAESGLSPGIDARELVFWIPSYRIINVAYHRQLWLRETAWDEEDVANYTDYLADFRAEFHDIRGTKQYADSLSPDSYVASHALAGELLKLGSSGIVYPSVRRRGGTCVVCFRPVLVMNVRKGNTVTLVFSGSMNPPAIRRR